MATTTNYGWTTPDNTDLVKDGAAAIRTLGSAIDTSMNTALGTKKAGLVLLNTTSFSAVASASINDVFSANYNTYKIIVRGTQSITGQLSFRVRVGGSDLTTSTYRWVTMNASTANGNYSSGFSEADTKIDLLGNQTSAGLHIIYLNDVFETKRTTLSSRATTQNTSSSGIESSVGGIVDNATSYTGFTLVPTGNFTGKVSVYGFNE